MRKDIIGLVALMVLTVFVFLSFSTGAVVYNPKAVPRVEVRANVVESDFIWNAEDGHYNLNMPNVCGKSDEELYRALVRKFPNEEAVVHSLTIKDIAFIMPDDDPFWHDIILKHWGSYGTINIVFYNALVLRKQIYSFADAEEIMENGGL